MIINGNCDRFLRLILSDNKFIQLCLQNVRCRNILYIKFRMGFFTILRLLLQLLLLRDLILYIHHIIHIQTSRKNILNIHTLHQICIVAAIHDSEAALHTVNANAHIVHTRNMKHTSCLTLRSSAHIADIFVFLFIFSVLYIIVIIIAH